jgi:glycosyltransferase involved in cell wall biosynthesis
MTRSYKIAMVAACPFPANYGTPGAIREMSVKLAEMGHQIHVVTYPFGNDLPVGDLTLHRVGKADPATQARVGPSIDKPFLDLRMVFRLVQVVRRYKIDLIHAHAYEGVLVGAVAKWLTGVPLLFHAVNLMGDELHTYRFIRPPFVATALGRFLDWFAPRLADHTIAVTPELERSLLGHGLREEKITMIPCGIEPAMFDDADPKPIRARYGLAGRRVVMYTGVTSAFQRVDYLLQAFAVARETCPDAVLMVVSPLENEPDMPAHRALAERLGITPHVIWAGPHTLAELPDYLACADVAVVPRCDCPGHPIKLLNYMMSGLPVACFASAAKGVTHGEDAWLAPDHDCRKLGEGIALLLTDRELAARLGAEARQTARERFDWQRLCQRVEQVYAALLETRGSSAGAPMEAGPVR